VSNKISLKNGPAAKPQGMAECDILAFSHLRWDFVFQRPQHLMQRFARQQRVFFIEEPVHYEGPLKNVVEQDKTGVWRVRPHLPSDRIDETVELLGGLLHELVGEYAIDHYLSWYYTPMAIPFTRGLRPRLVVYDCMDELSAFNGASKKMKAYEAALLRIADLVFTGGHSLYESKINAHPAVHAFPSSIDASHFGQARTAQDDPPDQSGIPHPRLGFFGVIDERLDLDLLSALAETRPDWHLVMIGPTAKVDRDKLPSAPNIHYLGQKDYTELPAYLSGWDVGLLPFALNEATRFISPTKTPEYLAGGCPVVSTPITDVVRPYGHAGLARIADGPDRFIQAVEQLLAMDEPSRRDWLERVDGFLSGMSWDGTWQKMYTLMEAAYNRKQSHEKSENGRLVERERGASYPAEKTGAPSPRGNGRAKTYDYLIVGAGFAGSVLAERLARGSNKKVLLIDRRHHIAGNAYDHYDEHGVLIHKYGPHIFHTNSAEVFTYLSRFTAWRPYEHRVLASVDGHLLPMPINLDTINRLYGLQLSAFELEDFFAREAEKRDPIRTSEDVVVSKVGRQIYEKFFRSYTRKQWGLDPSELDSSVTARVPIRYNRDDRYFTDVYQSMPEHGFTRLFENLLDHPNIHLMLNTDYRDLAGYLSYAEMIFTGPVDEYFDYRFGKLPYRSLQFKNETREEEYHQPVAVINYPNEHAYTRVTEFKHLTGQAHPKTSLIYEYPCSEGDPYYPIPRPENAQLYQRYKKLAEATPGVHFAGRLGTYRYYNMDQVTAQALALYARLTGKPRRKAANAKEEGTFTIEMPCALLSPSE
jgi:UDP-galactopyranose mutase